MYVWPFFWYALLCVLTIFAIIFVLIVFLICNTVDVLWLLLTVPWIGLQCVIMVFPDHSYLLFQ